LRPKKEPPQGGFFLSGSRRGAVHPLIGRLFDIVGDDFDNALCTG
jgi:hypothetical protein